MDSKMNIDDFFENREVFVTGGTGYLGKALIEKLLRDFPTLKIIYVLLRAKKSQSVEERLENLKKDKVFERIHKECPEVLSKLHAIEGDSKELGLGIKPQDLDLLKNVSLIFHNAANVKFDDSLRSSILLNSRGTHELLKIAENLKNLIVFVHCSTAYCNPFNDVVEEKIYEMPVDWRTTIKIAETYDEYTLDVLFSKYSGHYPNTYTFSKNISEQIIKDYSDRLPVVVVRPSIVTNAFEEPVPGWTDNMNGGLAGIIGICAGVMPLIYSRGHLSLDFVPIDLVTKSTIAFAYRRGLQFLRKETIQNNQNVINCASNKYIIMDTESCAEHSMDSMRKYPMENCVWYYSPPYTTSCYYWFLINMLIMSIPLALLIDTILRVKGHEPEMMKVSRRIVYSIKALSFFSLRDYTLVNKNMMEINDSMMESDTLTKKLSFFKSFDEKFECSSYFDSVVQGVKYNIFNENPNASDSLRTRYKAITILSQTIKIIVYGLILRCLWLYLAK